jgi:predicted dehydrogenase
MAAPTVITTEALGGEGRRAASERITIGYIGAGPRGRGNCRQALGCADAQVVAVCDVWEHARGNAKLMIDNHYKNNDCRAYADFREILDRDDIDAVSIASTDHWHVPMAVMAAKAGKDVSVEKPLGVSVREDQICRDVIKRYDRVFQYGTEARTHAGCRFACELVRNGRLGELREIRVKAPNLIGYAGGESGAPRTPKPPPKELDYELWLGPAPWRPYSGCPDGGLNWFHVYDYSLGFIAGWGAHPLDLLQWAFDTHLDGPWEVEGTGSLATCAEGCNDAISQWDVRIRLASGLTISFYAKSLADERKDEGPRLDAWREKTGKDSNVDVAGNYVHFIGSEGWIALPYSGQFCCEPESLRDIKLGPNDARLPVGQGQEVNFIECVRTRKTPVSNVDDAVRSDIISHVSDIAIRCGRKIRWDPVKEEIIGDEEASRMLARIPREPWRL